MSIAIIVLLVINLGLQSWVLWRYYQSTEPTRLRLRDVPTFTKGAECAKCSTAFQPGDIPVESYMKLPFLNGKEVSVTAKICQKCVADA